MATLKSKIILCKGINIDKNYVNVLNYTEEQMLSLCQSQEHLVAYADDYSFIRNRGTISTNFKFDDALQSNYIAFQNKDYSNKWFFAWIDEVNFIGEENTEIKYTIDYFSTWFRNLTLNDCFVVREHTNDDSIGVNTIPEDLDVGEVISESIDVYDFQPVNPPVPKDNDYYICILSTHDPAANKDFNDVELINGSIFGYRAYFFDYVTDCGNFIAKTNSQRKVESILALFMFPKTIIPETDLTVVNDTYTTATYSYKKFNPINLNTARKSIEFDKAIEKTHSFSTLSVKNNKCYCYPYNYLYLTNNIGNKTILKYEDFSGINADFKIECSFSIGGSIRCVPKNYKGIEENIDESIPLAKFPTGSWSSDAFTNWLTENAVNIATNVISTGLGIVTGSAPVLMSTAGQTANLIGQFYSASLLPSIEGGQNTADVNYSSSDNVFKFIHMRAKDEYMKIIDDYFTAYGYKTLRIKIPNITGRQYWNYVEIGQNDSIGHGSIPADALNTINNVFHKGVTIWHDHANIGNFALDNTIV